MTGKAVGRTHFTFERGPGNAINGNAGEESNFKAAYFDDFAPKGKLGRQCDFSKEFHRRWLVVDLHELIAGHDAVRLRKIKTNTVSAERAQQRREGPFTSSATSVTTRSVGSTVNPSGRVANVFCTCGSEIALQTAGRFPSAFSLSSNRTAPVVRTLFGLFPTRWL